ncbi:c-type cytochrome [Actibacterium sp. XHP0104]|uniref:c-type cytochrome n=1 Tax=Actibacterium sp. XHP0104 TaxID=2984335 RepID=UPI0021E78082|nr:cytochrome c [Actibacterium sp. XHP0104]MCV2881038.1 cytochrome c [Actibacterium sp. XHP0104]
MSLVSKVILAATAAAITAGGAWAAGHENTVVQNAIKARKAQMTLYAANLGILGAMAKGEVAYDAEAAATAARDLDALNSLNAGSYFVPGSDNMSADNTRTLPKLWDNFPDVMEKAKANSDAIDALNAAAGTDLAALQAAIGPVGKACTACHEAYRAPE